MTGIMLLLSAVLFLVGSFITSVYQGLSGAAAFDRLFIGLPLYVLFKLFALAWVFHVAQCVFQQSLEEQ
ncbi:MAG: hypothetical protein OEV85_04145 [Candidatus Thorarchaeota archaeon]|nr:hypothetical protein [Candidatus Thorarchaeota archaeon]